MKPQDYSTRTRYRPGRLVPAAELAGVVLTSVGLAPRDAVTLQVRGRSSGKTHGSRFCVPATRAAIIWWRCVTHCHSTVLVLASDLGDAFPQMRSLSMSHQLDRNRWP